MGQQGSAGSGIGLFAQRGRVRAVRRCALLLALAGALAPAALAQNSAAAAVAARHYDIPAGPLESVLNRFGREAGILLSYPSALTAGLSSAGLHGSYRTADALPEILRGTGLAAVLRANGSYALEQRRAPAAGGETTLAPVRVRAGLEDEVATGPVPGYVARRSTAGTRTDTPLRETPQSISVIGSAQIADQNAQTMQEVLRYTAGVRSDQWGLDNRGDWFTLRGGSESQTLLDGLRLPTSCCNTSGHNDPYTFDRVEVLRGPASILAGQSGPGGVVNLVSKLPQAGAQREVMVQVGNRDHKQIAADLGGALDADGTLLYRLVLLGKDADTQVDHAGDERRLVAPSLTWQPGDDTRVTVYAQYQYDESQNVTGFFPWAGTLLPAPYGLPRIPIDTFIGEPAWDEYVVRRQRYGYQFEHKLGEQWTLRQQTRRDKLRGHMYGMYANWWEGLQPDGSINRTWYGNDTELRITSADLLLEGHIDTGRLQHTLLVGADGMWFYDGVGSMAGDATPLNLYAPVYGTFPAPDFTPTSESVTRTRQHGLFVQEQLKIDQRWVVVAGLRRDAVRVKVREAPEGGSDDSAWSRRLGLVYLADGGWSPYASYSESFEAVPGVDAEGGAFKPKRGKQYEAGIKWAPADRRALVTAAVYTLKERNRLSSDPFNPDFSVQRGGEVTVKGAELEATGSVGNTDLIANYTYTDAEVSSVSDPTDEYKGKRLYSIPEHAAALWLVQRFNVAGFGAFRVGAGVRYVGKTWDGLDQLSTPSNTLADALLGFDREAWRFALNASNLFDKKYVNSCVDRGDCWYGNRRKVVLTAAYRW